MNRKRFQHTTLVLLAALVAAPALGASRDQAVAALAEGLARLDGEPDGVGLAVCAARRDQVLLLQTQGRRALDQPDRVDQDTRFRIASLSKGFAATVAAQLAAEGQVSLAEPVARHVNGFELKAPREASRARLDHVLSHRLGLPPNAYDNMLEAGRPVESIIRRFREVDPVCRVGTCYGYQNVGYNLVTNVIESRTGTDFEDLVRGRLLQPLKMNESGFGMDHLSASGNWARPHVGRGRWLRPGPLKEHYYRVPASAGINASVSDLCRWLQANLGAAPTVLPDELRRQLWTPQVRTVQEMRRGRWRRLRLNDAHYGYGWRLYDYAGETVIFHAGMVQGYGAQIALVPRLDIGLVALWNSESRRPWGITATFLDALLGLEAQDWLRLKEITPSKPAIARP